MSQIGIEQISEISNSQRRKETNFWLLKEIDQLHNKFMSSEQTHPADKVNWVSAIHTLQHILGMRILREDYKGVFPSYIGDKSSQLTKEVLIDTGGGFVASDFLKDEYKKITGKEFPSPVSREDPTLIELFKKYGNKISLEEGKLALVTIPYDIKYHIYCEVGGELIVENHKTWS